MTTINNYNSNNYNSNNFILGVNPKKNMNSNTENTKVNMSPSESLIDHLKRLEKESTEKINKNNLINNNLSTNKNKGSLLTTKSLNRVVGELIDKLEKDVYTLNNQIKDFNVEKKEIIDLNTKEINRLKEIIRKMYLLVITINKSIELNHNNRTTLLEKLRKTIESNKGFLKNVDEIMVEEVKNMDYMNLKTEKKNNLKILNIIDHTKDIQIMPIVQPEKKNILINPNNSNNSISSLNIFYNNLKKESNINNGKKQLIQQNQSRRNNNKNTLNNLNTSRSGNTYNNENNLNTTPRNGNTSNNENNLNTSSRMRNNENTSSRNGNTSNNENNLNTSSRNGNTSNNDNNLNTFSRMQNNENNLNTSSIMRNSSNTSNNENNLNSSSRMRNSSNTSNNENNLNTSSIMRNSGNTSNTSNNENSLNTSSRSGNNNEIENIKFNNLNQEKKNKKIEKKINSTKISEENAKKSLNKYFL